MIIRVHKHIPHLPLPIHQYRRRHRHHQTPTPIPLLPFNSRKVEHIPHTVRLLKHQLQLPRVLRADVTEDRELQRELLACAQARVWQFRRDRDERDAFGLEIGEPGLKGFQLKTAEGAPFAAVEGDQETFGSGLGEEVAAVDGLAGGVGEGEGG